MIKELSSYTVQYTVPDWLAKQFKQFKAGDKRFGTVEAYNETAKSLFDRGKIIVIDFILPISFTLPNDENIYTGDNDPNRQSWFDKLCKYIEDDYEKARKAEQLINTKFVPGRIINMRVADGYAYYIVTKVNKKTCQIEWRGWSVDEWRDRILGNGGRFDRSLIEPLIQMGG